MLLPFGRDPFFVYKNGLLYAGWNNEIDIKGCFGKWRGDANYKEEA